MKIDWIRQERSTTICTNIESSTYKERVDKLKFQLDGGENDVPVMETIRQLRTEFLKELDAYEKYEAGAREKYPLKALDDMAD